MAVLLPVVANAFGPESTGSPPLPMSGRSIPAGWGWVERDPVPTVASDLAACRHGRATVSGIGCRMSDPFNPLPFHMPVSRTRFDTMVLGTVTACVDIRSRFACPPVRLTAGTIRGMILATDVDEGAGRVPVEAIVCPIEVAHGDARPLHHVVVAD